MVWHIHRLHQLRRTSTPRRWSSSSISFQKGFRSAAESLSALAGGRVLRWEALHLTDPSVTRLRGTRSPTLGLRWTWKCAKSVHIANPTSRSI